MSEFFLFDLNELPMEETPTSVEENNIVFDKEEQSALEVTEPFVGQWFRSEDEAFAYYTNFARKNGFSIRKGRFINQNGEKKRRDFFCHREGKAAVKVVDYTKEQRNRCSTRCGCKAHMRIKKRRVNEFFPVEWQVTTFVLEHNHPLLSKNEVRFLPAYRTISTEDEKRIVMLKEGGLSVRQIMRVMELEKNISHGYLSFLSRDVRNFFSKLHGMHAYNDAKDILEYCKKSKSENPNFQYAFTVDEENKLKNIFFSPTQCFNWYQKFGDVVVFDTTYKVNSYDMPFGIFVGVDNHGRTVLFGCALLRDETTDTFSWLMKIFTSLMIKPPKTILTDQDLCISKAIAKEMVSTKHAFCIWHITTKFSGWFTSILRGDYSSWCSKFYSLYRLNTIEEFEQQWPLVMTKYNMGENKHVLGLYRIKTFWVPAYLRNFFFGGMTTTGRSESINAFIKRFISSNTCITQLIRQVDLAIQDIENTQVQDSMKSKYVTSYLRSKSPLEEQGYHLLTPFAFEKFQDQFRQSILYKVKEETNVCFVVQHHKEGQCNKHTVIWDGIVARCSCKNFEFIGILCRHILKVLLHKDCFSIPLSYWLSRWSCKEASVSHEVSFENATCVDNNELVTDVIDLIQCPPKSKTKGRPKEKRMKSGMELAKKGRSCRLCKQGGHNFSTCPEKRELIATNDAVLKRASKKKKTMSEHEDLNPILSTKL